jgi:nucleoid-associated protein YgaU
VKNKEVRIALAVVATLLVVFVGVLVWKLGWSTRALDDAVAAEPPAQDDLAESPTTDPAARSTGAGPSPTVLTATQGLAHRNQAVEARPADDQSWQGAYSGRDAPVGRDESLPPGPEDPSGEASAPEDGQQSDPFAAREATTPQVKREMADDELSHEAQTRPAASTARNELRSAPPAGAANPLRRGEPSRSRQPSQPAPPRRKFSAAEPPDPNFDPAFADEAPPSPEAAPLDDLRADESYAADSLAGSATEGANADDLPAADDLASDDLEAPQANVLDSGARSTASAVGSRPPRVLPQPVSTPPPARDSPKPEVTQAAAEVALDNPQVSETLPEGSQYRIAPRDTYWLISRKVYGDPAYYRALYEHNRRTHPRADKLPPGTLLEAPDPQTLERLYPEFCPRPPASADEAP